MCGWIIVLTLVLSVPSIAQVVHLQGTTMYVAPNAQVVVRGDVMSGAAIVNDGTIRIEGSLVTDTSSTLLNNGSIVFGADTARWQNAAPLRHLQLAGTISIESQRFRFTDLTDDAYGVTAMGHDVGWRIGGTVQFGRATNDQHVPSRYYTNLAVRDRADKIMSDGIAVQSRYAAEGGRRRYEGRFVYDGDITQIIAGEHAANSVDNRYRHLELRNGPKSVQSIDTVMVMGATLLDAASPTAIDGVMQWGNEARSAAALTIRQGGVLYSADSTRFDGDVIVERGLLRVRPGSTTIDSLATLLLVDAVDARLHVQDSAWLHVRGTYVNDQATSLNASYDVGSVVVYEGTAVQSIVAAPAASPYGHVHALAGEKRTTGDIHIASSLRLADATIMALPHTVVLTTGDAAYDGHSEVIGAMRRDLERAQVGKRYSFNNAETGMSFNVLPRSLTLDVRPMTKPSVFDSTTDVKRKVTLMADGDWRGALRVGYTLRDIPSDWDLRTSERLLRFVRATDRPVPSVTKLVPTLPPSYTRRSATSDTMGFVELQGLGSSGPDNVVITSGNDVLLRGSRDVLNAIANGRWSNPLTWDEGREPEPNDEVTINGVTVHVGYVRASDGFTIGELFPGELANRITIGRDRNSSLLFGSDDTERRFALQQVPAATLTVQRAASMALDGTRPDRSSNPIDGGLVIYPQVELAVPRLVVDPGATVINAGTLQVGIP